jgi:hypothetical protein
MYQNPVLNAPMGPDGLPMPVDQETIMEHYEVRTCMAREVPSVFTYVCDSHSSSQQGPQLLCRTSGSLREQISTLST